MNLESTLLLTFDLLQVSIGGKSRISKIPTPSEWEEIFTICKIQTLLGIAFAGISRLPIEQRPPKQLLGRWYSLAHRIIDQNKSMNVVCSTITDKYQKLGFWCCILKGQGNLIYYPKHLRLLRMSGDVDMWMDENANARFPIRSLLNYLLKEFNCGKIVYNHVEVKDLTVKMEIHFRPSWLNNPFRNVLLQQWFSAIGKDRLEIANIDGEEFPMPAIEFNVIYQLLHIYKHLFLEGVGLRQLLDYYMVLKKMRESGLDKEEALCVMRKFHLIRFASAVMHVLQKVFGMPDEFLIVKPDVKEGEFLLSEMLRSGNFGQYDDRLSHTASPVKHAIEKTKRNFHLVTHYPNEVLWEPFFRLYHFLWRKFRLWRWE